MYHIPTTEQVDWVGKTLGPLGVRLLSRIEILKSDEKCPAYCLSAGSLWPGCVQVIYPGKQSENPFIFVHEMAHAYHSIHFPHLTEVVSVARAEACALVAEETLANFLPGDDLLVKERRKAWQQAILASEPLALAWKIAFMALRHRYDYDVSLHNLFELILFGMFEDDSKAIRH